VGEHARRGRRVAAANGRGQTDPTARGVITSPRR
jgi:hypothetical protein